MKIVRKNYEKCSSTKIIDQHLTYPLLLINLLPEIFSPSPGYLTTQNPTIFQNLFIISCSIFTTGPTIRFGKIRPNLTLFDHIVLKYVNGYKYYQEMLAIGDKFFYPRPIRAVRVHTRAILHGQFFFSPSI